VLVGAVLQVLAHQARALQQQVNALQVQLQEAKQSGPATQAELHKVKNDFEACQQKSLSLEKDVARANQIMAGIAAVIPESIKNLQDVNSVLTGNVCSGGSSGIPNMGW
jgi:uncharacterized protein (DUF3084 family)